MSNTESVAQYYRRNKHTVIFRKVMRRCRENGSIPNTHTVTTHKIPIIALYVAFAEWAGTTTCNTVAVQHSKLCALKAALDPARRADFTEPFTLEERHALRYLQRFAA